VNTEAPIVFVIDDEPSVCQAARRLLRSAGYQVRTFSDTIQPLAQGRPTGPCCLVLDYSMPGENGLQFQQRLAEQGIRVPIIFITGHGDIPTSVQAMKSGAIDFLPKPFDADQLLDAVAQALHEDSRLLSSDRHTQDMRQRFEALTVRERDVFAAVAAGLLNKQIAGELGIAEKTVKVHRAHVMEKMNAVAFADLVRMADLLHLHWNSPENTATYTELQVG
jgi:FixJ family two-component response regulator